MHKIVFYYNLIEFWFGVAKPNFQLIILVRGDLVTRDLILIIVISLCTGYARFGWLAIPQVLRLSNLKMPEMRMTPFELLMDSKIITIVNFYSLVII